MSKGCPKLWLTTPVVKKLGDSKHTVRCCSMNGASCTSIPCSGKRTYDEAVHFCENMGKRLCLEEELNKCCGTGCGYDATMNWIAEGMSQS